MQWAEALVVALMYFLAAAMYMLLPKAEDQVALPWIASGVALAALLAGGYRLWPGVFLGAFAFFFFIKDVELGLVMGVGVCLQAIVGAALTAPTLASDQRSVREGRVLRCLFLAGPVSGLIGPTVYFLAIVETSATPIIGISFDWLTVWVANVVGILLLLPLYLLWQGRRSSGQKQRRFLVLPVVLTALFLILGNLLLSNFIETWSRANLEKQVAAIASLGFLNLNEKLKPLINVERFFAASDAVNREEFHTYVTNLIRQPFLERVDWAPRVAAEDRQTFEEVARKTLSPKFGIFEYDQAQEPLPSLEREDYYPIIYSATHRWTRSVIGLDHGFELQRRQMMDRARSTGAPAAGLVTLWAKDRPSLVVFIPVHKGLEGKAPFFATPARRSDFRGFVVGVIDLQEFFAPLMEQIERYHLAFRIVDVTPGDTEEQIAGSEKAQGPEHWSYQINLANRQWHLDIWSGAVQALSANDPLVLALLGFSLVAAYAVSASTLGAQARALANVARMHAVESSEANLRAVVENAQELIVAVDTEMRLLIFNHRFAESMAAIAGLRLSLGMSLAEAITSAKPHLRQRALADWRRALAGGGV